MSNINDLSQLTNISYALNFTVECTQAGIERLSKEYIYIRIIAANVNIKTVIENQE